jgi:hypothetical protein
LAQLLSSRSGEVTGRLVATLPSQLRTRRVIARFAQMAREVNAAYTQFGPDQPWEFASPKDAFPCSPRFCGLRALSGGRRARAADGAGERMRTASIRPGDIVRVDDGMPFYALVDRREGRAFVVLPINGPPGNPRHVKARWVVGHLAEGGEDVAECMTRGFAQGVAFRR